jgi:hypothetical protein
MLSRSQPLIAFARRISSRDALFAFYAAPAEHWKHLRTTDVLDKSLSAVVLWWPGTGDRMALSGAAAASLAGSPHPEDPAAVAGPVCLLLDFWRHPATSCS